MAYKRTGSRKDAAEELGVGVSAVSSALSRLRSKAAKRPDLGLINEEDMVSYPLLNDVGFLLL